MGTEALGRKKQESVGKEECGIGQTPVPRDQTKARRKIRRKVNSSKAFFMSRLKPRPTKLLKAGAHAAPPFRGAGVSPAFVTLPLEFSAFKVAPGSRCRTCGARPFWELFPTLTRWASLCHASGVCISLHDDQADLLMDRVNSVCTLYCKVLYSGGKRGMIAMLLLGGGENIASSGPNSNSGSWRDAAGKS